MVNFLFKLFIHLPYFYLNMDNKKQKEQEDKLKELAKKPVNEKIAKSIKEKQAHITKPICK